MSAAEKLLSTRDRAKKSVLQSMRNGGTKSLLTSANSKKILMLTVHGEIGGLNNMEGMKELIIIILHNEKNQYGIH